MKRLLFALLLAFPTFAEAQVAAPRYEDCMLTSIFPAGGRRGETVTVEFYSGNGNISDAREIRIDGPGGITVQGVKNVSVSLVQATFVIAENALPGRRCVRVLCERSGYTNMIYFTVGRLPEVLEKEPNNDAATAQAITLPVVVNGRVNPKTDVDHYRFEAKKGQRLSAVVLAHALDSHGQGANYGFADASLQVLDDRGRVIAEAGDTLGLDPLVEFVVPADGVYQARVHLEAFDGFPQAVYRLTIGDLPLATSVFPPGGQRDSYVEVEFHGPNVPANTKQKIAVPTGDQSPLQYVLPVVNSADLELPFVHGDYPERIEAEPNDKPAQATLLEVPMTVNGRIDRVGDEDWYRIKLAAGQSVRLETTAQRFLRSPVDTLIQVYDSAGKKLAENDDGFALDYVSLHDFRTMDSRLVFTAPAAGEYLVRVTDQSGSSGKRAVYRLSISAAEPTFDLSLYPDGVPVWGPGSTAALLVKVNRFDGLDGDIALTVDRLPPGWTGSSTIARGPASKPGQTPTLYYLLTITAPATAKLGEAVPFRVVGRADVKGRVVERVAQPLTLYYTSDTGLFRVTPVARAAVCKAQTPWLSTPVKTLSVPFGGMLEIPVEVHPAEKLDKLELTVDLATSGVATALAVPQSVPLKDGKGTLSVKLGDNIQPGLYGITVSLRWRSDIRIGMPGPCTPLIALEVGKKDAK